MAALGEAVVLGQLLPLKSVHGNADQELTVGPLYQLEQSSRIYLQQKELFVKISIRIIQGNHDGLGTNTRFRANVTSCYIGQQLTTIPALNGEFVPNHHGHPV